MVRLKIAAALLIFFAVLVLIAFVFLPLMILLAVVGLIYIEMIYPRWNFFSGAIQNVDGENHIALTFDDGPSPWTLEILKELKAQNVKATFFLLGKNVERYPEIAREILNQGHTIGMHGYSHTKLHWKGPEFVKQELDRAEDAFRNAGLPIPKLFRFPHGVKNYFAVKEVRRRGYHIVSWGRGVWDSKKPGVNVIVDRAEGLRPGEILLLHDGDGAKENADRSQTSQAVGPIVQKAKAHGLFWTQVLPPPPDRQQ